MENLFQLDMLTLTKNSLENFPEFQNCCPKLRDLDLSFNQIQDIPVNTLINLDKLQHLDLSHNFVTVVCRFT